ncbi:hypothetical protein FVB32_05465 [Flagellimonas hymeniacidonis]|uniref:Uncharacterized protein n=1 Tax=Flagellimonas hymeniacidonis TaxID=2603628 RepID=A0A5C8VAB7_9FLAO|nr:hypothetical protein [Flagellimonas hymeniacidonis]TXN37738.1 hypothetical protein FVB32_05465 [Flagellimonas hymeniacidonis]
MSKVKFNVVQTTGTFKNEKGEAKNRYQQVGVVFENEEGHLSMKLNSYPLPNEKGQVWINLFPHESNTETTEKSKRDA